MYKEVTGSSSDDGKMKVADKLQRIITGVWDGS